MRSGKYLREVVPTHWQIPARRDQWHPERRLDPGWLFLLAGLALCGSLVIVPAQSELNGLRRQLHGLRQDETVARTRVEAYGQFLDDVNRQDPLLIRRLAAAQLNVIPEGETPVLRATPQSAAVTDWIDATVPRARRPQPVGRTSVLERLANGRPRLWLLGAGALAVFVGVILDPSLRRTRETGTGITPGPAWFFEYPSFGRRPGPLYRVAARSEN